MHNAILSDNPAAVEMLVQKQLTDLHMPQPEPLRTPPPFEPRSRQQHTEPVEAAVARAPREELLRVARIVFHSQGKYLQVRTI